MDQVQGSTELISQPSIALNSSYILLFMDIKAATDNNQTKSLTETKLEMWEARKMKKWQTFIVDTLWREKAISALYKKHLITQKEES